MRGWWLVLLVAGCGRCHRTEEAKQDPVNKKHPPNELVAMCLSGVRALTEYADRCEGGHQWWGSIERAVKQLEPACEMMTIAPGAVYDRKEVEACAAAMAKRPCGAPTPAECKIGGTRKEGESCVFPVQCGKQLYCSTGPDSLCGVCARMAKLGEPCNGGMCDHDLVCDGNKCIRLATAGERCTTDYDCARMHYCDGTCKRLKARGEACGLSRECGPELVCESGKCAERPPPGPPGSKCNDALDCLDYSCADGKCAELGRPGDDCDPLSNKLPPCAPSLVCHKKKCVLPDPHACP